MAKLTSVQKAYNKLTAMQKAVHELRANESNGTGSATSEQMKAAHTKFLSDSWFGLDALESEYLESCDRAANE